MYSSYKYVHTYKNRCDAFVPLQSRIVLTYVCDEYFKSYACTFIGLG